MRRIFRDRELVLVFDSDEERTEYFETLLEQEKKRHSGATLEIHKDYLAEFKAENSYNSSTLKNIQELRDRSLLEAQVEQEEE